MSLLNRIFSSKEKSFSDKLDELGYFKYSPKDQIANLKKNVDKYCNQLEILSTPKDKEHRPIDLRYYFCDGEAVHKHSGYKDYIEYLKPTLEELEVYDETKAKISKSSISGIHVDSVFNLIRDLNNILDSNRINENWYPIFGGNDGQLILLSPEQFKFLCDSITDAKSKPFEIEAWRKFGVYSKTKNLKIDSQKDKEVLNGNRINHAKFGYGTIKEIDEKGVALISFEGIGDRRIIMKYAKYSIVK